MAPEQLLQTIRRRDGVILALVAVTLAWPASAASDPAAALLDQARGTPVEVFADVVFRLIDANQISDKQRAPLLDEVFLRAGEAVDLMDTRPSAFEKPVFAAGPVSQRVDALSIRCRAVKALLAVDATRARGRFAEIPVPQAPKPDCQSTVVPDPTIYFETLAAVVTQAPFTEEEQRKQVPFQMVVDAVRGAAVSLEIVAAARNFRQLVHTGKDAGALAVAFAAALGMDDSNRNFTAAVRSVNLPGAVLATNDTLTALGVSPQVLLTALRGYLVRHLTAVRCADSPTQDYDRSVETFNKALGSQNAIAPILAYETAPAKAEGEAARPDSSSDADYRRLSGDVERFLKDPVAPDAPDVLAGLKTWQASGDGDRLAVLDRKIVFYRRLLSAPIPQNMYRGALDGSIAALEDSAVLNLSPAGWIGEVQNLGMGTMMHTYMRTSGDTRGAPPEVQTALQRLSREQAVSADIRQAMIDSTFSPLAVYGKLAQLNPEPSR